MKKILFLVCLITYISSTKAQSITYGQMQNLYQEWTISHGKNYNVISKKLKAINPKWKLKDEPEINNDGIWVSWFAIDAKNDSTVIALFTEEDEDTIKYGFRYGFYDRALFNSTLTNLKASPYYKNGKISYSTDNSKGTYSVLALPNENLPMASRTDFLLVEYDRNLKDKSSQLYTVDIWSRYIPKK